MCLHDNSARVQIRRCVYMTTQPGLRFVGVFTRGRLESSAKNSQQAVFLPPVKRIPQSTRRAFSTWVELFTCIFQLFSTQVEISTRPFDPGCHVNARLLLRASRVESQPGLNSTWVENSSCKHSLTFPPQQF